jgi:hypothetical protein
MFCEQCKVEIPPAWVQVIAKNECPACGGEIMSEQTKELLTELKDAMERMPNDPEGLAGWLLSNYRLMKIGEAQPTDFYRAGARRPQDDIDTSQLRIADNPVKRFLARAGANVNQREDLQAIVAHIQQESNEEERQMAQDMQDAAIPDDPNQPLTDEQIAAFEAKEAAEEAVYVPAQSVAKKALANNSLIVQGNGAPPLSPEEQQVMSGMVGGGGPAGAPVLDPNADQSIPLPLQQARMEKLRQQKAALEGNCSSQLGGAKNSFRRGY